MPVLTLNNGVRIPAIGYGTYLTSPRITQQQVAAALSAGYRLIDTAQNYGNEREVGAAIRASQLNRDEIFVTSKTQTSGYQGTLAGIDNSLRVAGLDYYDLMIIHWPNGNDLETYRALEDAYRAGKVRAIGLSNFNHHQVQDIIDNGTIVPAVDQIETQLTWQQWGMHDYLTQHHILHEAWAPLGEGDGQTLNNPTLIRIGRQYGKTAAQVMLRFYVQTQILAIPKATSTAHQAENLAIFDFTLSDADVAAIKQEDRKHSASGWPSTMLAEQNY